ncbi:dihydroneopterin aldolase [Enemella dayhoffiae]|uniref:7,8-dihydroneopterin aldolase n=1 Tax=Enemella dayhoffiae TaxID=2016507 RepID=A0A255H8P2_9ACTN|nr:dihydroneopterin aldolase [Enemella dayhoffiae]OYO24088.1 dihydroneopterin aldolase [Enemella dayhoffiae]
MDLISLTGITGFGHHGVFAHEKRNGQTFIVDVQLEVDLAAVASSDDLADTVDYGHLANAVHAEIGGPPLDTIEALAGRIANTCLADQRVTGVRVTVHKPQAPVEVPVTDVSVTVSRSR